MVLVVDNFIDSHLICGRAALHCAHYHHGQAEKEREGRKHFLRGKERTLLLEAAQMQHGVRGPPVRPPLLLELPCLQTARARNLYRAITPLVLHDTMTFQSDY